MRDGSAIGRWLTVVTLLAAAGAACSGGTKTNATASSGGNSGGGAISTTNAGSVTSGAGVATAGGSSAVAGASGSSAGTSSGAPMTKYGACIDYINTECNRRNFECAGQAKLADPCPQFAAWCPDFLFADGSQVTVEQMQACTEKWRTFPCDQLNKDLYPECGLPVGTRADGEMCRFGRQCASTECGRGADTAHPDCGRCVPIGKTGDACADGSHGCPNGDECTGEGCEPSVTFNLPDGAACERYGQCAGNDLCFMAPDSTMRCQARRKLTEDCSGGAYCVVGATCVNDVCAPAPGAGEPCPDNVCALEAVCLGAGTPDAKCVARAGVGAACMTRARVTDPYGNCQIGLFCHCTGDGCAGTCLTARHEGEACGDATSFCVAGTMCTAGQCVGVESQGLTEAACGP